MRTFRVLHLCLLSCVLVLGGCASWGPGPLEKAQASARKKQQTAGPLEALERTPKTSEGNLEAGDRLRQQGRSQEAMLAYFAAIRMDPSATRPKERIGFIHLKNDIDRAESIFARLVDEDDTNATAWRGLGMAHLARGEFELSREALERSVALEPDVPSSRLSLASVLGLMGRPEEALPHVTHLRTLQPRSADAANALGMTYLLLDEPILAEQVFRRVVRFQPDVPAYANNLGVSLGMQERYEEAFRVFERNGSEQSAYNNLGYAYYLNGEHEMAISQYERALAVSGDANVAVIRNLNAAITAVETSMSALSSDRSASGKHGTSKLAQPNAPAALDPLSEMTASW